MVVWGSLSIIRALLDADLVDELQLRIVPVTLGDGIRLATPVGLRRFTLVDTHPFDCGIVGLTYSSPSRR